MVTRGGDPAFIATREHMWELRPPRFEEGAPEGSGDSMVGAMAAMLAQGVALEEALRWGAAAGAANFLRHGLGTGSRTVIEDLLPVSSCASCRRRESCPAGTVVTVRGPSEREVAAPLPRFRCRRAALATRSP